MTPSVQAAPAAQKERCGDGIDEASRTATEQNRRGGKERRDREGRCDRSSG
ncbi:hypothetical protein HMPREF0972_02063 [Actinomyces sp. oral taxon 848 str. F0332]|nr:hypothetical protein HMPREF0972_02063 [Actinomyces sp. oral taxon 848 str. F0332]